MRSNFVRYPIDYWTVSVMVMLFLASLWPLLFVFPLWFLIPYALVILFFKNAALAAQHNHAHLKVFRHRALNFCYDTLLTQITGYTTPEWEIQHARGHHQKYLTPRADLTTPVDAQGNTMNIWAYAWRGTKYGFQEALDILKADRQKGKSQSTRRFGIHLLIQLGITALLVALNPPMALIFFVASNLVNRYSLWWGTYWQHVNAPCTHVYDASNTTTHWGLNTLILNNGYHTAHHEQPGLHWSLLPERTQKIQTKMPAHCLRTDINFHLPVIDTEPKT